MIEALWRNIFGLCLTLSLSPNGINAYCATKMMDLPIRSRSWTNWWYILVWFIWIVQQFRVLRIVNIAITIHKCLTICVTANWYIFHTHKFIFVEQIYDYNIHLTIGVWRRLIWFAWAWECWLIYMYIYIYIYIYKFTTLCLAKSEHTPCPPTRKQVHLWIDFIHFVSTHNIKCSLLYLNSDLFQTKNRDNLVDNNPSK